MIVWSYTFTGVSPFRGVHMKNDFRGLILGVGETIYVKLKEDEKRMVRHQSKFDDMIKKYVKGIILLTNYNTE